MQKRVYSFDDFDFGSKLIRDLVNQKNEVKSFVSDFYQTENLETIIQSKSFASQQREVLSSVLNDQNSDLELSPLSKSSIESLRSNNTFTITTGHQLNLLMGPLFSIYKIAQIISISSGLNRKFPNQKFVPLFWMASEDHDFEEINHLHLFGKKIVWQNPEQKDVVAGRMKLAQLEPLLAEIAAMYQNDDLKEKLKTLTQFYSSSKTLADATRKIINHLFGEFGLVILDGNDKRLKENFKSVLLKEVAEELAFNTVANTNQDLKKAGYHEQVFVRNCNLFFIHDDGRRERIVKENSQFTFQNKSHSQSEIESLINTNPEKFSPNALLRPVYQETVLPNLVYVGGGGEISYWLQLKNLFEKLGMKLPMLRVRDSVLILNQKQETELNDLKLSVVDLQKDVAILTKEMTLSKSADKLSLSEEQKTIAQVKSNVLAKSNSVDKSLSPMVEAEFSKMISALEKIESKLIKTEKGKDETTGNKIIKLQEKLFPEKHLQERHDNFLPHYLSSLDFISNVIDEMKFETEPKIRIITR